MSNRFKPFATVALIIEHQGKYLIVEEYNDRKFNFLYFSNETDKFYVFNGKNYVVKKEFRDRKGNFSISYSDIDGVNTKISYRKFKELNQIV